MLAFIVTLSIVNGVNTSVNENTIYIVKDLNKYKENIYDMRTVVDELKAEVNKEKNHIDTYEKDVFLDDIININSQIEELKFYNGFTDVRGPGIMLRVSDSTIEDDSLDIMEKIVHDVDITILLNDLKSAGAEAIDVNSLRIINISEVVCAGPLLKINGETVPAPFIIRAIGDQEKLYNVVTEEGTYANILKEQYGMEVVVVKNYNLTVPRYKVKNYDVEYAVSAER